MIAHGVDTQCEAGPGGAVDSVHAPETIDYRYSSSQLSMTLCLITNLAPRSGGGGVVV